MTSAQEQNTEHFLSEATQLWRNSRYQDAIDHALEARERAITSQEYELAARCNQLIGKCYFRLATIELALEYSEEAENYWLKSGSTEMLWGVRNDIAMTYSERGQNDLALCKLVDCPISELSPRLQAGIYMNIGIIHLRMRRFSESVMNYYNALFLSLENNLKRETFLCILNIAACLVHLEKYDEALVLLEYVVRSKEDCEPIMMANALDNICVINLRFDRYQNLQTYAGLLQEHGDICGISDISYRAILYSAICDRYMQSYDEAFKKITKVEQYFQQAPSRDYTTACLQKTILYLEKDWKHYSPEQARNAASTAIDAALISKQWRMLIRSYEMLADACTLLGQIEQANSNNKKADELRLRFTAEVISQSDTVDHACEMIMQLMNEVMPPAVQ